LLHIVLTGSHDMGVRVQARVGVRRNR
jgi:hypothetical protein